MSNIGLRVHKRTPEYLSIMWSTEGLTKDQLKNVEIFINERKLVNVTWRTVFKKDNEKLSSDSVMLNIPHIENNLNPNDTYDIKILLNKEILEVIKVFPAGTLPETTRDKSKYISQIYVFNEDNNRWVKLPINKYKGKKMGLPVCLVGFEELAEKIDDIIKLLKNGKGDNKNGKERKQSEKNGESK